ncbi:MAG: VWA domain-containing protein [Candidatus Odinarchaeota archaeon]
MTKFTVVDVGDIEGRAYLCQADIEETLGIEEFDFVTFKNEFEDWGGVQILLSDEVDKGTIAIDGNVLDSANISDGEEVEVEVAPASAGIKAVKLGIEPLAGQDVEEAILWIAENFEELTRKLQNRPVFKGMAISWADAGCGNVKIRFLEAVPALEDKQLGIIDPTGREVEINIIPSTEMSFNAVLVLDVSGSMQKKDMKVKNISGALEGLRRGLEETPLLTEFIDRFQEGKRVSRVDAAVMSILLFMSLKIAKGWGEQVQVITFSGEVEKYASGGISVINCVGETKKAGIEAMIGHVVEKCQESSGLTFLSGAIEEAYKCIADFEENPSIGKRNPTMIVVLTDGQPNKGNGLGVNPIPTVKKNASGHLDVVMYTIGLGEADRLMLRKIGDIGRGGSLMADDMEQLVSFYDSLAQNFQMVVKTKIEDEE